jgi:hypothetical protein
LIAALALGLDVGMYRILVSIFMVFYLSGCATTCINQIFYKPFPLNKNQSVSWTNYRLYIDIQDGFTFSTFECGTAYRRSDNGPTGICITLYIDKSNTVTFLDSVFILSDREANYLGKGSLNTDDKIFVGEKDYSRTLLERILSKIEGWQRFSLNVDLPKISIDEFYILFPKIELNGKELDAINLHFKRVTDDVCHTSV